MFSLSCLKLASSKRVVLIIFFLNDLTIKKSPRSRTNSRTTNVDEVQKQLRGQSGEFKIIRQKLSGGGHQIKLAQNLNNR